MKGTVSSVDVGMVTAEVVVSIGGAEIVSVITKDAVEDLGLKAGDEVTAVVKATEVMIMK
jgi:molybdopterin-binding protein